MKKRKSSTQIQKLSPENYIRQRSRNLPIGDCYITKNWKKSKLCNVIITRNHANGNVTAGLYLVDLACTGVRDSAYQFNVPPAEIKALMTVLKSVDDTFIKVSYKLAHNIIFAGLEYAEDHGLKPYKEFTSTTRFILEEDNDAIPIIKIECGGDDGKPFYSSGSDSPARVQQVLAQLEKTVGKGNYEYFLDEEAKDDYNEEEKNEEKEEEKEKDAIFMEIEGLSFEEKKSMFFDLLSKKSEKDSYPGDDLKRLMFVTNSLAIYLADYEATVKQLDLLKEKLTHEIVENEEFPNSLFTGVQDMDYGIVLELFDDFRKNIKEKVKPEKAIALFRKKIRDIPLADFLELFYIEKKSKKYELKLAEFLQKYPDYFLFQAYQCSDQVEADIVPLENYEKLLSNQELPITAFEADIYFSIYSILFLRYKSVDLPMILAFEEYSKTFDFISDKGFAIIYGLINVNKMQRVIEHFKQT